MDDQIRAAYAEHTSVCSDYETFALGWRLGMLRAAEVCDVLANDYGGARESPIHTDFGKALGEAKAVGAHNCGVAIRAEAGE